MWKHYGNVSVKHLKASKVVVQCELCSFENHGIFEGLDILILQIKSKMSSWKTITSRSEMTLVGVGRVINQSGSMLRCTEGYINIQISILENLRRALIEGRSILINTEDGDVKNNGIISASGDISVFARNIYNRGMMVSETSKIEINFQNTTTKSTKLEGQVIAPKQITIVIANTPLFHFKCGGGSQCVGDVFILPKFGLLLKSHNGCIILKRKIEGNSQLKIMCKTGCSILRDIDINTFVTHFITRNEFKRDDAILIERMTSVDDVAGDGKGNVRKYEKDWLDITTECSLKTKRKKNVHMNVILNSTMMVKNYHSSADCSSTQLWLKTFNNSKINCMLDIHATHEIMIDGNVNFSPESKVEANLLRFTEISFSQILSSNQLSSNNYFRLLANKEIILKGKIVAMAGETFRSEIKSSQGNITIDGRIGLQDDLIVNSGIDKHILIEGRIETNGPIFFRNASRITNEEQSCLKCQMFGFETTSANASISFNGQVDVNGPMLLENVKYVTIRGTLAAKGVSANTANVYLNQYSITSLISIKKFEGAEEGAVINCSIDSLHTGENSTLRLVREDLSKTWAKLKIKQLYHRGQLEMTKSRQEKNELYLQVEEFINKGKFENVDYFYLECNKQFSNFQSLVINEALIIVGNGRMQNHSGSFIQCENGEILIHEIRELHNDHGALILSPSLTINATKDLINKGTMTCCHDINIKAADVDNTGKIESYRGKIDIEWLNETFTESSIGGQIQSPTTVHLTSQWSSQFQFNCTGGNTESVEEFILPSEGLKIICNRGLVTLNSKIREDSIVSSVNIYSFHGCEITADVTTEKYNILQTTDTSTFPKVYQNNALTRNESIDNRKQEGYTLYMSSCACLSIKCLLVKLNSSESTFFVETSPNGRICAFKTFQTNSKLVLSGNLDLFSSCSVSASNLHFLPSSKCNINFLDRKPAIDEQANYRKCLFYAEKALRFEGNMDGSKGPTLVIMSKAEDINLGGKIIVPDIAIVLENRKVTFCGVLSAVGILEFTGAKYTEVAKGAKVQCGALSCENKFGTHNKSEMLSIAGNVQINGPVQCTVEILNFTESSKCHLMSASAKDHFYINADSVLLGGYLECNIQGNCIFDCRSYLRIKSTFVGVIASSECIFAAKKSVIMEENCKFNVNKGNLYFLNEIDGKADEIFGEVILSGSITGAYEHNFEQHVIVEAKDIGLRNLNTSDVTKLDLHAAFTLCIDDKTSIRDGLIIDINSMTLEMKGNISGYDVVLIEICNMLILGKICDADEVKIKADLIAVNSGYISALKTGIVSPIYLNCPKIQAKAIAKLGNMNQKELIVEGLLCIIVGSHIEGRNIKLKSVLQFVFATQTSTCPEANDLKRWQAVVDTSLSKISSSIGNQPAINKLVEQAMQIPAVVCNLSVGSHLCTDIVTLTEGICKRGLSAFKIDDIVTSLNKAHSQYSRISTMSLNINLNLRAKVRKIRQPIQKAAKNLIKNIFGPNSFTSTGKFSMGDDVEVEEGITMLSFVYGGEKTDYKTFGNYTAMSLEMNGTKGLWKNNGNLEACGDIIVSSGIIEQKGRAGRLLKAINGSIKLVADKVDVKNIKADKLQISVSETAKVENADVQREAIVQGKDANLSNIKADSLRVQTTDVAVLSKADVKHDINITGKVVQTTDATAADLNVAATTSAQLEKAKVKGTVHIKTEKVTVQNISSEKICVQASDQAAFSNITVSDSLHVSGSGNIDINTSEIKKEVCLQGQNIQANQITANDIQIDAKGRADLAKVNLQNDLCIKANEANVENVKGNNVVVRTDKDSHINSINVTEAVCVVAENVDINDSSAHSLRIDSKKDVHLNHIEIEENTEIKSGNNVEMTNAKSKLLLSESKGNTDIGNINVGDLHIKSDHGDISLHSKVTANDASFEAKNGNVSLTGRSRKANHYFKSLKIHTERLKDIEKLLKREAVYRNLTISDHLGLCVEDQSVILASNYKLNHSFSLQAASINVTGNIDAKEDLELLAMRGGFQVGRQANIKSKKDILIKAKHSYVQNEGSSISAGTNLLLEAEIGSVCINGSKAQAGKSMHIKASGDINISSNENEDRPSTKSSLTSGSGDECSPAIMLESGRNINIKAADVKSRGRNIFDAKNDIIITTNTYDTVKTENTSYFFGLYNETTCTTTSHVENSEIFGEQNSFNASGNFTSIAGNIKSNLGTTIHATQKVSMLDKVTTERVERSTNILGGVLYHNKKITASEQSHGTSIQDNSYRAVSSITSETSNIEWVGSSIQTPGTFKEIAKHGSVTHTRRILDNNAQEESVGFFAGSSSNPLDRDQGFKIGWQASFANKNYQTTSDDKIEIGGNYSVTAQEFSVSSDIHVDSDMEVDARKIIFQGVPLKSDSNEEYIGVSINKSAIGLSYAHSNAKQLSNKAQNLYTGGKLHLLNAEDVTFDNANVDVGSLQGNIRNMNVISRSDEKENNQFGLSMEFDFASRTPGVGFLFENSLSRQVNTPTTINVRGGSQGLSVENLTMKGAHMSFDGNVHKFTSNILDEEVHEIMNGVKFGINTSRPKSAKQVQQSFALGLNHSSGRIKSCISSTNGTVDSEISNKINKNADKCRVVDIDVRLSVSSDMQRYGRTKKNSGHSKHVNTNVSKGGKYSRHTETENNYSAVKQTNKHPYRGLERRDTKNNVQKSGTTQKKNAQNKDIHRRENDNGIKKDGGMQKGEKPKKVQKGYHSKDNMHRQKNANKIENKIEKEKGMLSTRHGFPPRIQKTVSSLKRLIDSTGLKHILADPINDLGKDKITMEKVFLLLKRLLKNFNLPDGLIESIESIIVNADPTNLVTWICKRANIDIEIFKLFIDVITSNTNKEQALSMIVEGTSKYLGFSTEFIDLFNECLYSRQIKDFQLENLMSLKDGEILVKKMCSVFQIPTFSYEIIVQVMTKSNRTEKALTLLRMFGMKEKELYEIKESLTMSFELQKNYKLSTITVSYFQNLLTTSGIEYKKEEIVKILEQIAIDLGLDPVKPIQVQLIYDIMSTGDPFERTVHVIRYFAVEYDVHGEILDGILDLILKKDSTKLIEFLASVLKVPSSIFKMIVEAFFMKLKVGDLFKEFAKMVGISDDAVKMIEILIKSHAKLRDIWNSTLTVASIGKYVLSSHKKGSRISISKTQINFNTLEKNVRDNISLVTKCSMAIEKVCTQKNISFDILQSMQNIIEGDEASITILICKILNINFDMLKSVVSVTKSLNEIEMLKSMVEISSVYFDIPHDVLILFKECLNVVIIGPQVSIFVSSNDGKEFLHKLCSVLHLHSYTIDLIIPVIKHSPFEIVTTVLQLIGVDEGDIIKVLEIKRLTLELEQKYEFSRKAVMDIESLIASEKSQFKTDEMFEMFTNLLLELKPDVINKNSLELLYKVLSTSDPLKRTVHMVQYFAKEYQVPLDFVDGMLQFIHEKDPEKLIKSLASKLGLNGDVTIVFVKGLLKKHNVGDILKQLLNCIGIPNVAVKIIEDLFISKSKCQSEWHNTFTMLTA